MQCSCSHNANGSEKRKISITDEEKVPTEGKRTTEFAGGHSWVCFKIISVFVKTSSGHGGHTASNAESKQSLYCACGARLTPRPQFLSPEASTFHCLSDFPT